MRKLIAAINMTLDGFFPAFAGVSAGNERGPTCRLEVATISGTLITLAGMHDTRQR